MAGITNPNSCPGVGSFYVRETDTDFDIVRQLFDNGHEIGVTTVDGTLPQTDLEWRNSLTGWHFILFLEYTLDIALRQFEKSGKWGGRKLILWTLTSWL